MLRGPNAESALTHLLTISGDKRYNQGLAYTIVTENYSETGEFTYDYHYRKSMPCYGELRKYKKTHEADCTQPNNHKPGDLHYPFPEGHPAALVFPNYAYWGGTPDETIYNEIFSDESPFVTGFGGRDNVLLSRGANDVINGFIILDLEIDPTVLVNFCKNIRYYPHQTGAMQCGYGYLKLREAGASIAEAMGIVYANNNQDPLYSLSQHAGGYQNPARFSVKRWFAKNPNDLSGGTMADRFDYNRTKMADPFLSAHGIVLGAEMLKKFKFPNSQAVPGVNVYNPSLGRVDPPVTGNDVKDVLSVAREVFAEQMEKEQEPDWDAVWDCDAPFQLENYPSENKKFIERPAQGEKKVPAQKKAA